jgi:hypothetical protein
MCRGGASWVEGPSEAMRLPAERVLEATRRSRGIRDCPANFREETLGPTNSTHVNGRRRSASSFAVGSA